MAPTDQTSILTISAARYLIGHDVNDVLTHAWSAPGVPADTASRFHRAGFNLDVKNQPATLKQVQNTLEGSEWDGILIGWCVRGHAELTELFEAIMAVCVDHISERRPLGRAPKLYFCTGPDDVVNATLRNFPVS